MSNPELELIAYHEAGHVVMNYYVNWKVAYFEIDKERVTKPDKSQDHEHTWAMGVKNYSNLTEKQRATMISKYTDRAMVAMAGEISQRLFEQKPLDHLTQYPGYYNINPVADITKIRAAKSLIDAELKSYFHGKNKIIECRAIIQNNWTLIEELVDAVLAKDNFKLVNAEIELIIAKNNFLSRK